MKEDYSVKQQIEEDIQVLVYIDSKLGMQDLSD